MITIKIHGLTSHIMISIKTIVIKEWRPLQQMAITPYIIFKDISINMIY